jgi:hypothetical protein
VMVWVSSCMMATNHDQTSDNAAPRGVFREPGSLLKRWSGDPNEGLICRQRGTKILTKRYF